jgi:hypothetical protein
MATYIVGVVHTVLSHYTVDAESEEVAIKLARMCFSESEEETMLGNETDEIDRVFIDYVTPLPE